MEAEKSVRNHSNFTIELPYGHPLHREESGNHYVLKITSVRLVSVKKSYYCKFFLEIYTLEGERVEKKAVKIRLSTTSSAKAAITKALLNFLPPASGVSLYREKEYSFFIQYQDTGLMVIRGNKGGFLYTGKLSENVSPRGDLAIATFKYLVLMDWGGFVLIDKKIRPSSLLPSDQETSFDLKGIRNMKFDSRGKLHITVGEEIHVLEPDLSPCRQKEE